MATPHSPEGDIEEDEEIEWQKIAEAIDGIEKQYINARNSVGGASAVPFLPQNAIPSFPSALPAVQATTPPSTHPAPVAPAVREAPSHLVLSRVLNPPCADRISPGFNVRPSAVSPGTEPQPATSVPEASLQNQTSDVVRLQSLLEQQRGSLANHQNRIRSMQAELDLFRGLDVEKMRSDNARLSSALSTATAESVRLQEQLSYVKQELASLRDRRRAESIAMGASNEVDVSQVACTQVPGTQVHGTQKGDALAAATQSTPNHKVRRTHDPWQSQYLPIRVPRRKKRLAAANESNTEPTAALISSTQARDTKPQMRTPQSVKGAEATSCWSLSLDDTMSNATNLALRQHLFSGASGSSLWQLVRVAGQERLRDALLSGMGRDDDWPLVLEPMATLLKAGRRASLTALNCLYGLIVYSEQCQRKVAALPMVATYVMEALKGAAERADFTIAEKCLNVLRALLDAVITNGEEEEVVRIRRQLFSDDVLHWTRRMRTLPSSVLDEQRKLILGVRDAALSVLVLGATACMTSSSPPCDEDLRVLDEALTAASNAIRSEVSPPQAALSMMISAACHAPLTIDDNGVAALVDACVHGIQTLRVADEHAKKREKRVRPWPEEIVALERERKKVAGMVRSCIATLALLSRTADLVLRKSERNVVLGVLAVLAWPSLENDEFHSPKELRGRDFIKECRTVWLAFKKNDGM
ncbi:hypothetical protein BWQ96_07782 [Gracilariopsis chorda]|uniref:Uncharacterized protein n=1 Tax=Gracilariopsis chorda TaxID=448386 RepID=A0A2V3IN24_9FLOR|nr:hypothetical protein BWQ96_07782 [Gracilariopsis chorda]|eukprot:PXF42520.1 hypothetical protein BWQ96_07782 [Gracilariopsis chorda]